MARPTKELTRKRKELLEDYNEIFTVLKNCGGGLYEKDLSKVLGAAASTLKYKLDKCIEVDLIDRTKVTEKGTHKNVIRLTRVAWTNLGENRGMSSYQVDSLDLFFYRALYQKQFNINDLKSEFIKEITETHEIATNKVIDEHFDGVDVRYKQKSIKEDINKLNKESVVIKDYFLYEKNRVCVEIHYIQRKTDLRNLAEVLDLLVGILERYAYLTDDDYSKRETKNYITIDLYVVSDVKLNKKDVCDYIKNSKRRYYGFSKERKQNPRMYQTFKRILKHVYFYNVDKTNSSFKFI